MSLQIVFSQVPSSPFVKSLIEEAWQTMAADLRSTPKGRVVVEMRNSPQQSGLDSFACRIQMRFRKRWVRVKAEDSNVYKALHRALNKLRSAAERVRERRKSRFRERHLNGNLWASDI
jgi:ribosome-associated translation inhibitor RaiA